MVAEMYLGCDTPGKRLSRRGLPGEGALLRVSSSLSCPALFEVNSSSKLTGQLSQVIFKVRNHIGLLNGRHQVCGLTEL